MTARARRGMPLGARRGPRRLTGTALLACSVLLTVLTTTLTVAPSSPGQAATSRRSAAPSWTTPCLGTSAPTRYDHVVWIIMENKPASSVLSSSAPVTRALARRCGHASAYHAVTHPSLPNYLALTSGSTHGITDDQPPARHRVAGPSIFSQVSAAHGTWATYAESMSGRCARVSTTLYAVKHNPAAYYTSLASTCSSADLPLGTPTSGPLIQALRTNRLPTFALIVPNMCHDTHDCSVSTGDAWLGTWLPRILSSSAYQAGRTAVFITWDEDDESHGNQVMLLEVAPSVPPGWTLTGRVTHLNLLRTTEDMLGLAALVPSAASMRSAGRL